MPRGMPRGMEDFRVTGITSDLSKILITVSLARPTVLGALWDRAGESHLSVVAPQFSKGEVSFFSDRDGQDEWKKNLEQLVTQGFVNEYRLDTDTVPLSVVGDRFSQDGTALCQVIEILAAENIQVTIGNASALSMTVGVPFSQVEDGIRVLHSKFLASGVL